MGAESDWQPPDDTSARPANGPANAPANGDDRQPFPGAMGPPNLSPPPRLSAQPHYRGPRVLPPTGPALMAPPSGTPTYLPPPPPGVIFPPPPPPPRPHVVPGAWQGALKPPVFVVPALPRVLERPTYREPLPVRSGRVWAGAGAAALWMLLFGLQASTIRAYAWITIAAAVVALGAAGILAKFGDRGVAVGVAISSGIGLSVAGLFGAFQAFSGHWILW
jgi:hypothetical protein